MRFRRPILIILVSVAVLVAVGTVWMWYASGQPLYEPGMLHERGYLRGPLDPPTQPADSQRWLVEKDIELHHWSIGNGNSIVVLHGGPGYPIDSTPQGLAALSERYSLHFYDQRGCGNSTRPFDRFAGGSFYRNMIELERTLGIGAQVADIERIRRILNEDKLILIGHSFGAFLATMYAAEFPERVRALVLVAPAGVLTIPSEDSDFFVLIRQRLAAEQRGEFDAFVADYLDFERLFDRSEAELAKMNQKVGEYFLAASNGAAVPADEDAIKNNGGWMVQAVYLSMGKRHDYQSALARVKAPTLVEDGTEPAKLQTCFSSKLGVGVRQIKDGTSDTLTVVEGKREIPWTKPEDIAYDPAAKRPELGVDKGGCYAAFGDGTTRYLDFSAIDETGIKAFISPASSDKTAQR